MFLFNQYMRNKISNQIYLNKYILSFFLICDDMLFFIRDQPNSNALVLADKINISFQLVAAHICAQFFLPTNMSAHIYVAYFEI